MTRFLFLNPIQATCVLRDFVM